MEVKFVLIKLVEAAAEGMVRQPKVLHFDQKRPRVAEAAVESVIARFQRTGSARRWDGSFFTTWPTPLIGNLAKVDRKEAERRNCAIHFKPKPQLTMCGIRIECCENIFFRLPEVTEKRYYLMIYKKFTSRDIWKKKTRTTNPRQHGLCQNGKSGSSSDNIVTWDIRSQRSWLVHYDMQGQGKKLYRLFLKSCSTTFAAATPSSLRFKQCIGIDLVDLEVRDGTSPKALNVVCRGPKCFALVDKLHRENIDERVQNCLGETLRMAGDHCT